MPSNLASWKMPLNFGFFLGVGVQNLSYGPFFVFSVALRRGKASKGKSKMRLTKFGTAFSQNLRLQIGLMRIVN